jgi:hypothetical protein
MSTKELARRAKAHFNCGIRSVDRHNRRAWIRNVRQLGSHWLLAPDSTFIPSWTMGKE